MTHLALVQLILVDLPERRLLTLAGTGSPDAPTFGAAIASLYGGLGAPRCLLEGLCSSGSGDGFGAQAPPEAWRSTLMPRPGDGRRPVPLNLTHQRR